MRALIFAALFTFAGAAAASAQDYVVVVNASADAALTKSDVADIFMKRKSGWSAVDQDKGAAVRSAFSRAVMGRDVSAVEAYWQQQIFAGKDVPPPVKPSDAEVLAFVRSNPNGIGYVQAGTALGDGVKTVSIE